MDRRPLAKGRVARDLLLSHAEEIYQEYRRIISEAAAAGNFKAALEHLQWLVEHMPKEDGVAIIDESAAKPKALDKGPSGPTLQLGIAIGGIPSGAKALPPIEAEVIKHGK